MKTKKLVFITLFIITSCIGPDGILKKAIQYEQKQKYELAEQQYLKLILKFPNHELTAEAMYRLGLIYKNVKQDFVQSQMWFKQVVNKFPNSKYKELAEIGLIESPDYSGVLDGNKVILGDSETQGRNMLLIAEYKKLDYNLYVGHLHLYAGKKFVREEKKYYLKIGTEIREYPQLPKEGIPYVVILKLPYRKNNVWKTYKEGKTVFYKIVADEIQVTITGKTFNNCIKVVEQYEGSTGIKNIYYAPNVGCIRITTGSIAQPDKEYPVSEFVLEGGV